jgi:signal transduction histidine kinase
VKKPKNVKSNILQNVRMRTSIRKKLLLFSLIILLSIGATGYAVYTSNQRLFNSEQWVQHTERVINLSDKILRLGIDMETATRGFVITNDSTFLEPLYNAQKTVFVNIAQLRQLTYDNLLQEQRVDSLNFYMHRRLNFSLQTIALRSKQGLIAATTHVSSKEGKQYADRLRQITNSIQQSENILLKQRSETNRYSVIAFNWFLVLMFILMIVSAVLLLITTGKYLRQTTEKEKQAAQLIIANKELVFQNEENKKKAAELIHTNNDIKRAEEKLIEANNELEAFSYSVSHDLRAPLRAIHGYTKMLKANYETALNSEGNRLMNNILNNAKKMGQLIDDLLAFSRIGRNELVKMNIPMQELVTNLCNEVKNEQTDRTIEFRISHLFPAPGDNTAIKQVWLNLISNAVKYSRQKEKTIIEIGCEIKENEIIYYIKDNGAGFDMRYANKLFGVFQRLHSDEEFEGTGVGLALVQRIIVKHGGRVWGESKVNEGATFYFTLNKL